MGEEFGLPPMAPDPATWLTDYLERTCDGRADRAARQPPGVRRRGQSLHAQRSSRSSASRRSGAALNAPAPPYRSRAYGWRVSARRPPLPPGPWLVVGLARSGAAAARALWARGEPVIGVDAGEPPEAAALHDEGIEIWTGVDGLGELRRARAVVKSPGVPREAPLVVAARELGLPVLGELELGWRLVERPFVAVTGTNGKTTTAELLGAIWRAAGREVAVAGNVGTAVSSLTGLASDATVVCEASSFQLEDALAFAPEVAVLLNVTPDHLDRHGTFEDYRDAKLRDLRPPARRRRRRAARGADGAAAGRRRTRSRSAARAPTSRCATATLEWRGRELLPRGGDRAARRAQRRERDGRRGGGAGRTASSADAVAAALRDVQGRRAPPRAGRDDRRRHLGQRLEGDERRLDDRRARRVRRAGAPDPRRRGPGPELRRAARAGRGARARRLPRRRGGARARATRSRARVPLEDCGDLAAAVEPRARARRSRARSCCCRRPARASISSRAGSRSAARASRSSSPR